MATFCVGTMSSSHGWEIDSVEEALSRHFTYWFTSRRNQSKIIGKVPSFYFLWMKYGKLPETLREKAQEEFQLYLKELFPDSSAEFTFEYINGSTSLYSLRLSAQVISDGKAYDLGRTIQATGEYYKVLDDARLNNG